MADGLGPKIRLAESFSRWSVPADSRQLLPRLVWRWSAVSCFDPCSSRSHSETDPACFSAQLDLWSSGRVRSETAGQRCQVLLRPNRFVLLMEAQRKDAAATGPLQNHLQLQLTAVSDPDFNEETSLCFRPRLSAVVKRCRDADEVIAGGRWEQRVFSWDRF